jgi:uncharacterized protein YciI
MPRFAVFRSQGPGWRHDLPLREQPAFEEHRAFMNALADEGFVVIGGPLANGDILLAVDAASEDEIRRRLADDPWEEHGLGTVTSVVEWNTLLLAPGVPPPGTDRLA